MYLIHVVRSEGSICMKEPLVYGVKKFEDANKVTMNCLCTMTSETNPIMPLLSISRDNISIFYAKDINTDTPKEIKNYSQYLNFTH